MFEAESITDALQAFQEDLTAAKANTMGWIFPKDGDHVMARYKALLFGNAGKAGDPSIIKASFNIFSKFSMGDKSAIPPDIKKHVFDIVAKYGGESDYYAIQKIYLQPQSEEEKLTALESLGSVRDVKVIRKSLQFALGKDVKSQDMFLILTGLQHHANGVVEMWSWAKTNWDLIVRTLPSVLTSLSHVVMLVTCGLTTPGQIQDVVDFFKTKSTKGFDQALGQSYDTMNAKRKWVQRHSGDVQEFLSQQRYLET